MVEVEPARERSRESLTVTAPTADPLAHEILTIEQEVELAQRIEAGLYAAHLLETGKRLGENVEELEWLAADGQEARTTFINSNLRLAMSNARKYRTRGFTEEDVLQDAYHGLVKAVDRFDYTKGFKFSTYAVWWIRESVLSACRATAFVKHPEVLWNQIIKVRAVRLRLIDETGTEPSVAHIAKECDFTEREVARCIDSDKSIASLQAPIGEDGSNLGDLIGDDEATMALSAVESTLDRAALINVISTVVASLNDPITEAILRARFGLDGKPSRSVSVVADELGMARQTVRRRERDAIARLQHPRFADLLAEYRPTGT